MDPRVIAVVALLALVAVEVVLYVLVRSSQRFRESLSRYRVSVEPLAVLVDVGSGVGPRRLGKLARYSVLTVSAVSVVFSAYMFYSIVINYLSNLIRSLASGVGAPPSPMVPLLPGITFGLGLLPPILVAVGIGLAVHEFAHLAVAVVSGVPVRGWGIGLAVVFPLAYVRVDEERFSREGLEVKTSVLGAGVAANLALALASLAVTGLATQALYSYVDGPYLVVVGVEEGMPAARAGLEVPSVIVSVNGTRVDSLEKLRELLNSSLDRETVFEVYTIPLTRGTCEFYKLSSTGKVYTIRRGLEDVRRYGYRIGVTLAIAPYLFIAQVPDYLLYTYCQLQVLYVVNLSLAIINSAPLLITDGGKLLTELLRSPKVRAVDRAIQWTTVALTALVLTIGLSQALTH
ncbi:MAG: site-2 protease family protein [Desulfurococcaceae archaeon]|jgi:membrane-associated protease RseP (regulator of RpoE activity)|nr:site-2 protease family protein [Desulfurococcaceae archaeon]